MAVDLVSRISQALTPQMVNDMGRAVGINEAVAQKLVSAAIPTVLGALATIAASPGGTKKLVDAVSNSDPDLLTKLGAAISAGNIGILNEGANKLGGLLGGSGLSNLAGALSQYAGVPVGAAQSTVGAVTQAAVGAIGQEDPSNWSDPSSIAAMFREQKTAIAAVLPSELSRALNATGLLAGLGDVGTTPRRASSTPSRAASAGAPTSVPTPPPLAAPRRNRFPIWAIILLIVIVAVAIWWFMSETWRMAPAKQGMLDAPKVFALAGPLEGEWAEFLRIQAGLLTARAESRLAPAFWIGDFWQCEAIHQPRHQCQPGLRSEGIVSVWRDLSST